MCLVQSKSINIDTVSILRNIINSLKNSGEGTFVPRYCTKVSPLQHVCIAKIENIKDLSIPIIKEHFKNCSASSVSIYIYIYIKGIYFKK